MTATKTNRKFTLIFIAFLVLGIAYGGYKYIHSLSHETTDDAQVSKKMNPIIPRVGGYISEVFVKDNALVKKGDTLFTIDNSDYLVKVAEAKAALVAAENSYEAAEADIDRDGFAHDLGASAFFWPTLLSVPARIRRMFARWR